MAVVFCIVLLLSSCGTAGRNIKTDSPDMSPTDSTEKRDTFVPLHPPVVLPHTWREMQQPV